MMFRKKLLIVLIAMLSLSFAFGQSNQNAKKTNRTKKTWGLVLGGNYPSSNKMEVGMTTTTNAIREYSRSESIDGKYGYNVGLTFDYLLNAFDKKIAIQYSFLISQKNLTGGFKSTFIDVPIIPKYYISDNFTLGTGLQMSFLLASAAEDTELVRQLTFGWNVLDVGLIPAKIKDLGINVGYVMGLGDLVSKEADTDDIKIKIKVDNISYSYVNLSLRM